MTKRRPLASEPMIADADAAAPWKEAERRLAKPEKYRTYWLATVRPEGRPHVMPVLGLWLDDAFYFVTGPDSRKGQNLTKNPNCVLAVGSHTLPSVDLILEGTAARVRDRAKLRRVASAYESTMHWPLAVGDGEVSGQNAPTAGPPPYAVFELSPTTVFGLPGVTGMAEEDDAGSGKARAKGKKGKSRTAKATKKPIAPTRWRFDPAEG